MCAVNDCLLGITEWLSKIFDDIDIDKDERMSQAATFWPEPLKPKHIHDGLAKVMVQVIAWIMTILKKEYSLFLQNWLMVLLSCACQKNKFISTRYISRFIDYDWPILFSPADTKKIDLYIMLV